MKKLLILLFSLSFLGSPSVFADDIDLHELSIKYPQCQNSTYRDECFDDFSFGKDGKDRWVGYFRDNLMWEGLKWQNDVLTHETYEGVKKGVSMCHRVLDGWHHCPDGQKWRPLEDGYVDDIGKQGTFITHFENGEVYEGNWENGARNGYGKYTWSNGDVYEGNFENGVQNGHGKYTWSNGNVYEGNFENGVQNGHGKYTWSNGIVYEGNWENGIKNGYGTKTWWYENGQMRYEDNFKDGKKDGKSTRWYENDQKEYERFFKDGKKDGKWTTWYKNGQIQSEGNYIDGKKVGKWTMWHENGQIKSESTYKDGECVSGDCPD